MFEKKALQPTVSQSLRITGCQIYALKKLIQLFCMTWGASAINFIGLKMEKSIQGSVCLTVFSQKKIFGGNNCFFLQKQRYFWKNGKCFFENNKFFLKKNMFLVKL